MADLAQMEKDAQLRNGTAARTKALYCGAVVVCIAMVCVTWGPENRVNTTIGFAGMFLFQFWNFLKGDATHATATAAVVLAKSAADEAKAAAKSASDAVLVNAANFSAIKKAEASVKADIKSADDKAEARSQTAPPS